MRRATPFVDRRTDLRERRSPASSDKPASGFSLQRAGGDVSPTTTPNREPDTSLHCRLADPRQGPERFTYSAAARSIGSLSITGALRSLGGSSRRSRTASRKRSVAFLVIAAASLPTA